MLDQEEPVIISACWISETRIYEIFLGRCRLLGTYSDAISDIVSAISREQKRAGAQRIVLAGDIEVTRGVRTSLPERLRALIIGIRSLPEDITESGVAKRVAPLLRAAEHREEQEHIHLLAQKSAHSEDAVVGLPQTLHMITKQQAGMIVLQQGYEAEGSMCNNCDALLVPNRTCPYCGSLVYTVDDIVVRAVERASRDGAIIEFVPATADIASLGYIGSIARSSFPA
jgi:peptide subunit release factor 1 (eRF1)